MSVSASVAIQACILVPRGCEGLEAVKTACFHVGPRASLTLEQKGGLGVVACCSGGLSFTNATGGFATASRRAIIAGAPGTARR